MIDLDEIKSEWLALKVENASLQQKNKELTRRLVDARIANNQQKLAKNYRIGYMGLCFPLLAWLLYQLIHPSVYLCIIYSVYGIILGLFDLWFMDFIKKADYTTISTINALEHASKVVIYQNWATIASIIACIGVLALFFYEMAQLGADNIIWGGVIGGVIGGIIGTRKCIDNHRLARRMLSELRNIEEEE